MLHHTVTHNVSSALVTLKNVTIPYSLTAARHPQNSHKYQTSELFEMLPVFKGGDLEQVPETKMGP